jgi:hypothetical protein
MKQSQQKAGNATVQYMEPAAPRNLERPRFGSADEARKLGRLIRHIARHGFRVHSLAVEGEGYIRVRSERAAVCEVFEWDAYVTLRFARKGASGLYGVLIITGNGDDILSDWTCDAPGSIDNAPAGTFSHAMNSFLVSEERREV